MLVIRWCLDGIRIAQLAVEDGIGGLTACRYVHEDIDVLTACAPEMAEAIAEAKAAGHGHLNLHSGWWPPTAAPTPGPNEADLRWSGKHKHHGGNIRTLSDPTGWPIWASDVRPSREHDVTCAKAAGLMPALRMPVK